MSTAAATDAQPLRRAYRDLLLFAGWVREGKLASSRYTELRAWAERTLRAERSQLLRAGLDGDTDGVQGAVGAVVGFQASVAAFDDRGVSGGGEDTERGQDEVTHAAMLCHAGGGGGATPGLGVRKAVANKHFRSIHHALVVPNLTRL